MGGDELLQAIKILENVTKNLNLDFAYCIFISPPDSPILRLDSLILKCVNFLRLSRGPVCHSFLWSKEPNNVLPWAVSGSWISNYVISYWPDILALILKIINKIKIKLKLKFYPYKMIWDKNLKAARARLCLNVEKI